MFGGSAVGETAETQVIRLFMANSFSRARSAFPLTSSRREGMNGLNRMSFNNLGAKSDVVVRNPLEALSPSRTPSSARTSFAVTRWPGLYALT